MEATGGLALILTAWIACLFLISSWKKMYNKSKLPPGPTPLPLIGNLLHIKRGKIVSSLMELSEKYGSVYTLYMGTRSLIVLHGYDAVKEALLDHADDFSGRGAMPSVDRFFQSHGVVISNGDRWKQLRRFTIMTLRNFGMGKRSIEERIQEEAQLLVESFKNLKGLLFDPNEVLNLAVSNVICSIVFSQRFDYEDKEFAPQVKAANEIFQHMSSVWGQLMDIFPDIMNHIPGRHQKIVPLYKQRQEFILKKVKLNQQSLDHTSPRDYIDCFLIQMEKEKENPASEFNMKNLLTTVENLFFAGTETVSSTLTFGLLILLKYPEIEERIHHEIESVIGRNRCPTIDDRSKMPYTDAVIHEIQRFSDILPMDLPHSVTRDIKFRDFFIPKGTDVLPLLCSVLRDSKMFKDPNNFNPEHFLDEDGGFKPNEAFMPFSAGKRMCLAEGLGRMELFLFFTNILQNFSLQSPRDPKDIDITPRMTGFANQPPPYQISLLIH